MIMAALVTPTHNVPRTQPQSHLLAIIVNAEVNFQRL
jgi:hypothetical protein